MSTSVGLPRSSPSPCQGGSRARSAAGLGSPSGIARAGARKSIPIRPENTHAIHPAPRSIPDQLDVKSKALHGQGGKELARDRAVEELEATLRIPQTAYTEKPDQKVEGLAHELAMERLM